MSTDNDGVDKQCWTAICPECGGCLGVLVAPDHTSTKWLRTAVQDRCDWERRGYTTQFCTVGDVRTGDISLGHRIGCSRDKRAKRTPSTATSLPFGA